MHVQSIRTLHSLIKTAELQHILLNIFFEFGAFASYFQIKLNRNHKLTAEKVNPQKKITMDAEEFRKFGYAAVDFVADYLENIRDRFVFYQQVSLRCILP